MEEHVNEGWLVENEENELSCHTLLTRKELRSIERQETFSFFSGGLETRYR